MVVLVISHLTGHVSRVALMAMVLFCNHAIGQPAPFSYIFRLIARRATFSPGLTSLMCERRPGMIHTFLKPLDIFQRW